MPNRIDGGRLKFLSPASFWLPEFIHETGWERHIPFAFYLTDVLRPRTIVELGVCTGLSYFAFCQAVAWLRLDTQTTGVDNWGGDQGGYFYDGDDVYRQVSDYNGRYPFSRLIRANFSDAVSAFDDESIDLLHIDGDHLYESVYADFRNYRPKLSADAIVLFHDTRVGGTSGVWRVFEALEYPKFEFFHACGLGMVGMGRIKDELRSWFEGPRPHLDWVRRAYTHLGETLKDRVNMTESERVEDAQMLAGQAGWVLAE